ncbi:Cpe/LpqF family protein [Agromyces atrinae]|uniref:Cpe/LpqF family protein n=1 Tax=Agromyces atrinae TaxID=592376 RepID=UPI001F55C12F|nr:Cpe/LpqF family protein [Agromyces atrinae]MCI2959634.1 Cpe/LpqF family protein [Agromyces atrinae]
MTRLSRSVSAALAVVLIAATAACSSPAELEAVEIPSTPVGEQTSWVVESLSSERAIETVDVDGRFTEEMIAEVPLDQLALVLDRFRETRPWVPTSYDGDDTQAVVRLESTKSTPLQMTIAVDDAGTIAGLFFGAPSPEHTPASSFDELTSALGAVDYDAQLYVSEAGETVYEFGNGSPGPIASAFKLYVLGAVVDAVAAGELAWDDELVIDDAVKSLPSGELQDRPSGSTVDVIEAASKMIAISDNTATDLLIRAVGRDAVEAQLEIMGHSDPSLDTPFATTREFFWIGWGNEALKERWADGDEAERRAVLADVPAGVPPIDGIAEDVVWTDDVDWFATATDLVRAHEALQQKASTAAGQPVRGILSANPGIDFGDEWTYVGFKGGSSTGVMSGAWYLEREGGEPVVAVMLASSDDPTAVVDPAVVFAHVQDAVALTLAGD